MGVLRLQEASGSSREGLSGVRGPVRSLYIHVPFCFHKCHYCDFYSIVDTQDRQEPFTAALELELACLSSHARAWEGGGGGRPSLETVFVGGGTPSLLRVDLWERLLGALRCGFELRPGAEFTVECNPETVTPGLMGVLARGGVNRVSIGAQSFESRHLRTLERRHDPASVERALRLAAEAGIARRSVDLIFGVPGQTADEWAADLERALSLAGGVGSASGGVEHLSCYALTYEPGTAMTARLERGEFRRMDDDGEADLYEATVRVLRGRGLERYEVSNFALPGCESRHNLVYWRQGEWMAAGPSASAHLGGRRWKNVARLSEWMEGVTASGGYSPVVDAEEPDARRALSERVMTGLRLSEGLAEDGVMAPAERLGCGDRLRRAVEGQERLGLLRRGGGRWTLTERGFLHADGVAWALMGALAQS